MDQFMRKIIVDRKIVQQLILNKTFNQITKDLKVGKRRVKKVYDLAFEYGYLSGTILPAYPQPVFKYKDLQTGCKSPYDVLLQKHVEWIKSKIELGWKTITIFEEIPIDRTNANMEISSFYRFLRRHNIKKQCGMSEVERVVPEIFHEPGEVLQLDWGKLRDVTDPITGKKKILWAFVGVMGFSRYMLVKLVWDNKTETTLKAIEEMFKELGGVPKKIVSDNPKCFSIEASKYEPILNPAFERFCSHYNIIPEILAPRDPKKKGKVERQIPYIRRLYEAHGLDWDGIEESRDYLNKKMILANERIHGTTKLKPIEIFFQHEASVLGNLPNISYEIEEYHLSKVRKDGHVRFRNKYYSVEEKYHSKQVFIIGNSKQIEIYHKCELIETHKRVNCAHTYKSTKNHHLKPWEQVAKDSEMYLDKAGKIGANVRQLINDILMAGKGFVDTRKVWGILSLDKDYEKKLLDQACKYALEIESLSYQTVRSYLKLTPQRKLNLKSSANNKFIRSTDEYKNQLQ